MDLVDLLRAHGGCLRAHQLKAVSGRQLHRAVLDGTVLRPTRGSYVLADTNAGVAAALQLRGVRSHSTAAAHWGFTMPPGANLIHVTIPRKAHRKTVVEAITHYRDLRQDDIQHDVTSPLWTVIDCLRDLCLRDAISVGDSALRSRLVDPGELLARADALRGPRSALVRQRARLLDARADNAFESSCRAILIDAKVSGFVPQLSIRHQGRFLGRVDLGHRLLRIVLECESFAHHGYRAALRRDCRRYTNLEAAGWRVLRVTWEDVMFEPEWVLARVQEAVAAADASHRGKRTARRRNDGQLNRP